MLGNSERADPRIGSEIPYFSPTTWEISPTFPLLSHALISEFPRWTSPHVIALRFKQLGAIMSFKNRGPPSRYPLWGTFNANLIYNSERSQHY